MYAKHVNDVFRLNYTNLFNFKFEIVELNLIQSDKPLPKSLGEVLIQSK